MALLLFTTFQIPVAVAQNVPTILVSRFTGGAAGSAAFSIPPAMVVDFLTPAQRLFCINFYMTFTFVGPVFSLTLKKAPHHHHLLLPRLRIAVPPLLQHALELHAHPTLDPDAGLATVSRRPPRRPDGQRRDRDWRRHLVAPPVLISGTPDPPGRPTPAVDGQRSPVTRRPVLVLLDFHFGSCPLARPGGRGRPHRGRGCAQPVRHHRVRHRPVRIARRRQLGRGRLRLRPLRRRLCLLPLRPADVSSSRSRLGRQPVGLLLSRTCPRPVFVLEVRREDSRVVEIVFLVGGN